MNSEPVDDKDQNDDDSAPSGNGADIENEPVKASKPEAEEFQKQYLYLRADFDNYRKQSIRERAELLKFGSEPLLKEFLNIFDNLERAAHTELTPETMDKYKSGIEMIVTQFKKTLERFGVEEFDSLNQPFDPSHHEALTSDINPDLPPNTVSQVFKKGFKLNGKIIRPAQVVVNTAAKKE